MFCFVFATNEIPSKCPARRFVSTSAVFSRGPSVLLSNSKFVLFWFISFALRAIPEKRICLHFRILAQCWESLTSKIKILPSSNHIRIKCSSFLGFIQVFLLIHFDSLLICVIWTELISCAHTQTWIRQETLTFDEAITNQEGIFR